MKPFSKGFLEGAGIAVGTAVAARLLLLLPSVKVLASHWDTRLSNIGIAGVTIFLLLLIAVLVVLLIRSRISYYGLKRRIIEKRLTIGDHIDAKELKRMSDDWNQMIDRIQNRRHP